MTKNILALVGALAIVAVIGGASWHLFGSQPTRQDAGQVITYIPVHDGAVTRVWHMKGAEVAGITTYLYQLPQGVIEKITCTSVKEK